MKILNLLFAGALSFLLLFNAAGVYATTIAIDFNSLPSAQGWVFEHSTTGAHFDTTEAGMFFLADGVLTGNTIGDGLVSPSGAGYNNYTPISNSTPWQLDWTMQVTDYENNGYYYGAYLLVSNGTHEVNFGYGVSAAGAAGIHISDGTGYQIHALDIFVYHDYRLTYTPDFNPLGPGTWALFVDNSSVSSGQLRAYDLRDNSLGFGDGTGAANARWNMTAYSFSQVPEPATLLLLASGIVGLAGFRKKIKQ